MQLADNALLVLRKRYLIKDEAGNPVETPDEMFRRVASAVAAAEEIYPHGRTGGDGGGLLPDDGGSRVSSQLPHPHERGPALRVSLRHVSSCPSRTPSIPSSIR